MESFSFLLVFTEDRSSVSGHFVGCHGWEGYAVVLPGSGMCWWWAFLTGIVSVLVGVEVLFVFTSCSCVREYSGTCCLGSTGWRLRSCKSKVEFVFQELRRALSPQCLLYSEKEHTPAIVGWVVSLVLWFSPLLPLPFPPSEPSHIPFLTFWPHSLFLYACMCKYIHVNSKI